MSVPSASFNENHIERLARAEFAKKPHANFTWLRIHGDKGGAPLPKPSDGITYDYWHRLCDLVAQTPNELAEMISIGDNAVIRMRDASGTVSRKGLAGKDPLIIDVESNRFEIVYIAFSSPGRYVHQSISVYIQTHAPLRVETGLELLRRLDPIFPGFEVAVAARHDAWFIYEPSYPFFNPSSKPFLLPPPLNTPKPKH